MATYRAFPTHRVAPVYVPHPRQSADPAALQAYALQQEQARQADIKARADAAQAVAMQRAESEAAKLKAQQAAEAAKQAANFNALTTRTNAEWNMLKAKQAAKDKAPTIDFEQDTPLGKVKRKVTEDQLAKIQFEADKKNRLDALAAEREVQWNRYFPGGRQVSAIDKEINDIKAEKPPEILGGNDLVSQDATPTAPAPIQQHPLSFSGATSWTGPGFAPVESKGFIGTPGGANSFIGNPLDVSQAPSPPITDAAPPDLLASQGFSPAIGDLRQSEAAQAAQDAGPAPVQKIYDKNRGFVPMDAQGRPMPTEASKIPASHIDALIKNPDKAKDFEDLYGEGSASQFLDNQP